MDPTEAFSQYGRYLEVPSYVYFIAAFIILAGATLFYLKRIAQIKLEQEAEFNRFRNYAKECCIEDQLWEALLAMIETLQIKNPINILKNTNDYDNALSSYLKSLLEKGMLAGEYEEILLKLTKIRSRVAAKVKANFRQINSTADLTSGLDIQIEVKDGPFQGFYDTTIASASANNLVIHSPTFDGKKIFFEPGQNISFTFNRDDDAVYQFTTSVVGKYQGSLAAIVFQNTDKIITSHVRKYTRISPNFLIKIIGIAAPNGDIHHIDSLKSEAVTISDISGGGMQIKILPGSKLLNYIERGKILAYNIYIPEIGPIEELKGRILRSDFIKEQKYTICSLEFVGINSKNRCRLLQGILVFLSKNK